MPSRRYSWGGIRKTGNVVMWCIAMMLISTGAHALTTAPDVGLSIDEMPVQDQIGTNFLYYQGRNESGFSPLLKGSGTQLPQPEPLMGSVRAVVLLVEDPTVAVFSTPWHVHEQRFFSKGKYNDTLLGRAGSARDFYLENSQGLLDIQGRLEGIYRIAFEGFYPTALNALAAADEYVNFAEFDNDGPDGLPRSAGSLDDDGFIDMLVVVYSGLPSQITGVGLPTAMGRFTSAVPTQDGVSMNEFIMVPELGYSVAAGGVINSTNEVGDVGGIVHEMGHLFGLPDLYDVDGSSEGIGSWGLMGAGSWLSEPNENGIDYRGSMPAHLCAWSKYQLGWLNGKIEKVETPGERILDAIALPAKMNKQAFLLWYPGTTGFPEHFLCEYKINKPNPGASAYSPSNYIFDATHPLGEQDRGILALHIDDSIGGFDNNNANVIDYHPRVMVVQPDGNFDLQRGINRGDDGDVFTHESSPPRSLLSPDKDQYPNSYSYDNRYTGISMRTVAFGPDSATVEFDFINDEPEITIVRPAAGDVTNNNYFRIIWRDEDENDDARIELYYSFDGSISSVTGIRTNAVAIVGEDAPLSEDEESDRYDWNTYKSGPGTEGYVPPGKYYIYAIIRDTQAATWTRSRAPLEVIHNEEPTLTITKPAEDRILVDNSFDIFFNASDEDPANTTIELWATSQVQPSGGFRIMSPTVMSSFGGNFHYLWDTSNVPGQMYYIYGIIKDERHTIISDLSQGSLLVDHKPTFTFIQPSLGTVNEATGTFVIRWSAFDEESTATIDLFYSAVSGSPVGATEIVTGLEETRSSYVWDLRLPFEVIEQDQYYIWARIDDGVNPARWVVSPAPVQIMEAVGVDIELVDMVGENQRIDIESSPTEVIGLNLNDNGLPITLDALRLEFVNVFESIITIEPDVDFKQVQGNSQGGVGVYRDGPGLIAGEFDEEDIPVIFQFEHPSPKEYFLMFQDGLEIPDSDTIVSASDSITGATEYLTGPDYFVVVRTSEQLQYGDGFIAEIPEGGLWFSNGQNKSNSIRTNPVLANIATFIVDLAPEAGEIKDHEPIAVLGVGMADGPGYSETLNQVKVRIQGNLTQYDLEALAAIDGGVGLYLDDGNGVFGPEDLNLPVLLATTPVWTGSNPYNLILTPEDPIDVPDTLDGNPDFYVVIRAGDFASFGHDLSVCIPPNGLSYSVGFSEKSQCSTPLEIRINAAPTIVVTSPSYSGAVADKSFEIRWEAFDPDNDARISLYYTTRKTAPLNAKLIISEIQEGTGDEPQQDSFIWSTQNIPEGEYYIYATITDGLNPQVSDISKGTVRIRHEDTIFIHSVVGAQPGTDGNLTYIEAESEPFDVFGINIWDYINDSPNDKLQFQGLTLNFHDRSLVGAGFDQSDLKRLSSGGDSGVVLYIDNGDQEGTFDIRDEVVPLAVNRWLSSSTDTVELKLATPYLFPQTDDDLNFGDDFYVAIQTSSTIEFGDRFQVEVPDGGMQTNSGLQGSAVQTVTIAANVPTLFNNLAGIPSIGEEGTSINFAEEYVAALGIEMSDNGFEMNFDEILVTADETLEASWEWDLGGPWNRFNHNLYLSRHSEIIPAGGQLITETTVDGRDSYLSYSDLDLFLRFENFGAETDMSAYSLQLTAPNGRQWTYTWPSGFTIGAGTFTASFAIGEIVSVTDPLSATGVRGEWTLAVSNSSNAAPLDLYYWDLTFERDPTFSASDLMPISEGGIALWEDLDGNGIFNKDTDRQLPVSGTPYLGDAGANKVKFDLSPEFPVPDENDGISDVFVVIRPSATIARGDTFYIEVEPYSIVYDGTPGEHISGKGATSFHFASAANTPPSFEFIRPGRGNWAANRFFRIEWEDDDPDDNASISLYYDNNNEGFDGVPIVGASNLFEDPDEAFDNDSFTWDTAQVSPGRYYLYAVVTDGENEPVRVYSGGTVTVSLPIVYGYSDLTSPGQRIDATSSSTPVIGIRAYDQGLFESIESVTIEMTDVSGTASPSDLQPFTSGRSSGIALYRDDGTVEGLFDYSDSAVACASAQWVQSATTYSIVLSPLYKLDIPDDNEEEYVGDDFYVVIRTGASITLNDQFQFRIPQNGLLFRNEAKTNKSVQTNVITANVPTFLSNLVPMDKTVAPQSDPVEAIGITIGDIDGYAPTLDQINVGVSSGIVTNIEYHSQDHNQDQGQQGVTLLDIEASSDIETAYWVMDFPLASRRDFRLMKAEVTKVSPTSAGLLDLGDIFIDPRFVLPNLTVDDATPPLVVEFLIEFTGPTTFSVVHFNEPTEYLGDIRSDFVLQLDTPRVENVEVLKIPHSSWRASGFDVGDAFFITYEASVVRVGNIGEDIVTPRETLTIRAEDWVGDQSRLDDWISFQTIGGRGFKIDHLLPMMANGDSGLALWQDADGDGEFNKNLDTQVALAQKPSQTGNGPWIFGLKPAGGLPLTSLNTTDNLSDLFITVQASENFLNDSIFNLKIPGSYGGSGMVYSVGGCNERIQTNPIEGRVNVPPTIEVLTPPEGNEVAGGTYQITWRDFDPDDDADITLYYTEYPANFQALTEILTGISENNSGEFGYYNWQVGFLPVGKYYVVAKIDDGDNPPVWDYSNGYLIVANDVFADATNLLPAVQWLDSESEPTAVLGLNMFDRDYNANFEAVTLEFIDQSVANGVFDVTDLKNLTSEGSSGVAIYRDNGIQEGVFDEADSVVPLAKPIQWNGNRLKLSFTLPPQVPNDDAGTDRGNDFFVVVRTSRFIQYDDAFQVRLVRDGIQLSLPVETDAVDSSVIRAIVPTLLTNLVSEPTQVFSIAEEHIPVFGIDFSDNGGDQVLESIRVLFNDESAGMVSGATSTRGIIYNAAGLPAAIPNATSPLQTSAPLRSTITVDQDISFYDVILSVSVTHDHRGDLRISLTPPWGDDIVVFAPVSTDSGETFETIMSLPVEDFPTRMAAGTWTLSVQDRMQVIWDGTLQSWSLQFLTNDLIDPLAGGFTPIDLLSLSEYGVALWEDVDQNGVFDEVVDAKVPLSGNPYIGNSGPYGLKLNLASPYIVPDTQEFTPDLFLVVRPSESISRNDAFSVTIPRGGLVYNGPEGVLTSNKTATSGTLVAEFNVAPTIELLTPPAGGATSNNVYTIRWEDEDPDDNAEITLYYTDNPNSLAALNLINTSPVFEDPEGQDGDSYDWDVGGIAKGRYWIVAAISDGQNTPVYVFSPGYIDITDRIVARLIDLIVPDPSASVRWVEPNYRHFPVIGINAWDLESDTSFSGIELEFIDESLAGAVFEASDLLNLNTGPDSGLAIYVDLPPKGMFSPEDFPLTLSQASWDPDSLTVSLSLANPYQVPDTDTGDDAGIDFFVALRTSQDTEFGDRFRVRVPEDGLVFSSGRYEGGIKTAILASSIPTTISDSVPASGLNLQTGGSYAEALSIAAADNTEDVGMEMFIESLKVELNDLTFFQNGNEIVFDASPMLAIPDGDPEGASTTIDVSPEFEYSAASVFVDIQHSRRGEIRFTLTSPEGRVYTLYNGVVTDQSEDVRGRFNVPLQLNGFRQALGPWTLNVFDDRSEGGYVGTLVSWELSFVRRPGATAVGLSASDLYPIAEGGVALFEDTNGDGAFNPGIDERMRVEGTPFMGDSGANAVTLHFASPYPRVPDVNDATPDFFVAVRPSERLGYNDRFSVGIPRGGIRYNRLPDKDLPLVSRKSEESGTLIGRLNQPPYIRIIEPQGPSLAIGSFRITWEDFDLNDDARVFIFFDTDDRGYDGTIVPGGRAISEDDESDYLIWDISENNPNVVAGGRYWIYAVITDSKVTYRSDYSLGYVQVRATNPEDYLDYVKLHGDGYIFSSGNYDINLGTFLGSDVARDLEVTPDDNGFFVLVSDGHIEFMGNAPDITMGAQPYAPANDAVALEVNYIAAEAGFWDYGGYVATAGGQIIPFGVTGVDVSGYTARAGHEITDILLDAEQDGLYVLYEDGVIEIIGDATQLNLSPRLSGARAVALRRTPSGEGLYMLDSFGGMYEAGDAEDFSSELPYFGFDIARGFIVSPTNSGVAVMTGEGRVHASDGVRVARDYSVYNSLNDIFRDIEPIGGRRVVILDILERIYAAFNRGGTDPQGVIDEIMQYFSPDYFDDSYNTREDFRKALEGFFQFYMIGERKIAAEDNNPSIEIAGPDAFAEVLEYWHLYIPGVVTTTVDRPTEGGDGEGFMEDFVATDITIPFTQRAKWFTSNLFSSNSLFGMTLDIYDVDYEQDIYTPGRDSVTTYDPMPGKDLMGKRLDYEGADKNNLYQYVIGEDIRQGGVGPFDFNLVYYPGFEIFSEEPLPAIWEFQFEDGQWKVVRAELVQFLFDYDSTIGGTGEEAETATYIGGFDFFERSAVLDDGDRKVSHLRYDEGDLVAPAYPEKAGVVNLTQNVPDRATGIYPTTFDEITIQEIRDIPNVQWQPEVPAFIPLTTTDVPQVYAVKFQQNGSVYFGLIRILVPVGQVTTDDDTETEGDGFVFDWRFSENFKLE